MLGTWTWPTRSKHLDAGVVVNKNLVLDFPELRSQAPNAGLCVEQIPRASHELLRLQITFQENLGSRHKETPRYIGSKLCYVVLASFGTRLVLSGVVVVGIAISTAVTMVDFSPSNCS